MLLTNNDSDKHNDHACHKSCCGRSIMNFNGFKGSISGKLVTPGLKYLEHVRIRGGYSSLRKK